MHRRKAPTPADFGSAFPARCFLGPAGPALKGRPPGSALRNRHSTFTPALFRPTHTDHALHTRCAAGTSGTSPSSDGLWSPTPQSSRPGQQADPRSVPSVS